MYDSNKEKFQKKTEYIKAEQAKEELTKYIFYFNRYANHNKSEKHSRELRPVIKKKI